MERIEITIYFVRKTVSHFATTDFFLQQKKSENLPACRTSAGRNAAADLKIAKI